MGLFDIFREANEEAHGARLERGLQETSLFLARMDEDIRVEVLMRFMAKREKLLGDLRNMPSKGRIDMGRTLQDEARKNYDINITEAYALWLAGAWLESMERPSRAARATHASLSDLAARLEGSIRSAEAGTRLTPNMPNVAKCQSLETWPLGGGYSASFYSDVPNVAGFEAPFEYLHVLALFSEGETLPIYYVTAEKSFMGGVMLCTFDADGNHGNFGADQDWSNKRTFVKEALHMAAAHAKAMR